MKTMTIRNIPQNLAEKITMSAQNNGQSLNATVIALLKKALGHQTATTKQRDLSEFCGSWTEAECNQFEEATACFSEIDDEVWQ